MDTPDPDAPDPVLIDLLVEWDERATAGTPTTPEEVCRDHPDRLAAFRRHLGWAARARGLLAPADPGPPAVPGFDRLREVGRGGMGVVYAARDVGLDCPVALKVPHPDAAGAVPLWRFEREARTLAKLGHPGIVPIKAAALTGGRPYFVMELMPGGSLAAKAAAGPTPAAEVVALLEPVARAVHHAHAAGVIHRDLKPSNVLLDADGRPRVGDFGVAALLAAADEPGPAAGDSPRGRLSQTGRVVGTPAYTAPELHPGGGGTAGPTSDVWSLGVILYELLTGRLPFGPDPVAEPPATWAVSWPPGVRVDGRLRKVVGRCLAEDPAGRYPTAAAVADALAGWRWRQRVRRVGLFAAAGLAVAALAAYLLWPPPAAVRQAARLRDAHERLARGEVVPLSPDPARPHTFDPVVWDPAAGRLSAGPGGEFVVDSGPDRPALIDLLAGTRTDRFEFSVEVRQEEATGDAYVGLYYARQSVGTAAGPAHLCGRVWFSDLGPQAAQAAGPDGGRLSLAVVDHVCLTPPYTLGRCRSTLAGPSCPYPPPATAAPWRRLSVRVDGWSVRAAFSGLVGDPAFDRHDLEDADGWARDLYETVPLLPRSQITVPPGGALGVYVYSSRAAFRNARVGPLESLTASR